MQLAVLMRLYSFRSVSAGEVTDHYLRAEVVDGLKEQPGLRHALAGRIGAGDEGRRIVASLWDPEQAPGVTALGAPWPFEMGPPAVEPAVELHEVAVGFAFGPWEEAQILRVFRGRVRAGSMEAYQRAVREGTTEDNAAGRGPLGLFLAAVSGEEFVTVSIWSNWARIEEATGGNVRQPIATRHPELLAGGTAEHFEIVPNAAYHAAAAMGSRPDLRATLPLTSS